MVTGLQRAALAGGGGCVCHTGQLLHPTAWGWSVLGPAELGLVPEPRGTVGGGGSQGQALPWRCQAAWDPCSLSQGKAEPRPRAPRQPQQAAVGASPSLPVPCSPPSGWPRGPCRMPVPCVPTMSPLWA